MNDHPGFDVHRIARLEERRQALGVASVSDEAEPISTGMMCFAGKGSWANQAMGLGMGGAVSDAEFDRLVAFYESRGVEPRLEVCPLADETLIRGLAGRGFVVCDFENVLAMEMAQWTPLPVSEVAGAIAGAGRVEFVRVDPANEAQVAAFIDARASGFNEARTEGLKRIERRLIAAPNCVCLLAMVDGEPAAGAACEVLRDGADDGGVEGGRGERGGSAALFGGTTFEKFRRRGLQRALIVERLRVVKKAAAEGACAFACISSKPGGPTERNALRLGFRVIYTKVTMVRPGEGLAVSL